MATVDLASRGRDRDLKGLQNEELKGVERAREMERERALSNSVKGDQDQTEAEESRKSRRWDSD